MNVCLWGVINGVTTFVPRILKHGEGGHIVNNASMSGVFASGQAGLYITAKYGVLGLTETIATDLQNDNIGCSVYCPGPVHTNLGVSTRTTRPASLSNTGYTAPRQPLADGRQRPTVEPGQFMDPIEVGRRVLRGIGATISSSSAIPNSATASRRAAMQSSERCPMSRRTCRARKC